MAPWQLEAVVGIENLDIVPVIEPEEQDGAEEPEEPKDLEDLGGWEEPDDIGGYPTGEE